MRVGTAGWAFAAAAWTALYTAWIAFHFFGSAATLFFDDLALPLTELVAAGACAYAAMRFAGRRRWAWGLTAAGCLAWGAGDLTWSVEELWLHIQPFPSPADAFYISALPLATLGIALLPAPRRRPTLLARALVDGGIVGGVLLWVSWAYVGQAVVAHTHGDSLSLLLSLAYPIADVAIATAAIYAAAYSSPTVRPAVITLALGWVCNAVADSAFAYTSAVGSYQSGDITDAAWVAGFSLVAFAGFLAARRPWPPPIPDAQPAATAYVCAILAAGILASAFVGQREVLSGLLYWDGIVVIGLVLARQWLFGLDSNHLERERVQALGELRATQGRLDQLLSTAPVVIFAVDADGTVTLARGSGIPGVEHIVGTSIHEFKHREASEVIERALKGQDSAGPLHLAGGVTIEVRCQPLRDGDRVTGVVGVGLDVTDRLAAVEARRESRAKDRFLANMSHELRTPLNSILGFTQLLGADTAGSLNERQRRYQQHILTSGLALLDLINELLDLAKVRAGGLDVDLQPLPLAAVIEDAVETVRPQADAARLRLVVESMNGLAAQADPRRLRQVLLNVLTNAVKFTPPGGEIRVGAAGEEAEVRIEVTDTGIGIPEADQERIFDEFTQLEEGRNRAVQGTGLGLALSRALARRMGGDLRVRSAVGRGSTFSVLLPAALEVADELAEPAQPLA